MSRHASHAREADPLQRRTAYAANRPRFTIGRDHRGIWVVQDCQGRVGGLFASEAAALHFAAEESNHNPSEICRAPDGAVIDLDSNPASIQLH